MQFPQSQPTRSWTLFAGVSTLDNQRNRFKFDDAIALAARFPCGDLPLGNDQPEATIIGGVRCIGSRRLRQSIGVRMKIAKNRLAATPDTLVCCDQRGRINLEMLIWIGRDICCALNLRNRGVTPKKQAATLLIFRISCPFQQLRMMLP
jgi:hypothetical protein